MTVLAVHDAGVFQMDGNAQTSLQSNPAAAEDWDLICKDNPSTCTLKTGFEVAGSTTATSSSHENDGALNASIFHGSSKDPGDISTWRWKDEAGGLPDKDNLLHAYAARYSLNASATCPSTTSTCSLIYFGSDRYSNDGDATQAFWFLQNRVSLSNRTSNGGFEFDGLHRNGDVLVISEFSNGGTKSTITIYKWLNGALAFVDGGEGRKCGAAVPAGDAFCGIVNESTTPIDSPWAFLDKAGSTQIRQGELFEAGINLSDPSIALADECFSSFVAETRSSTSTTATLKDFVLGQFEQCGSATVTTPQDSSGTNITAPLTIGANGTVQVQDRAVVTGTGAANAPTPTGNVKFFICGPTLTTSTALCTTGGTQVGTPAAGETLAQVSPGVAAVTSDLHTITTAGRYCFRADYTGDSIYLADPATGVASSDSAATECLIVNPRQPTISTNATAGPLALGSSLDDTATLGNTANKPNGDPAGGTITFTAYGPHADTTTCTTVAYTSVVNVSGNGNYTASTGTGGTFTPTLAGTYNWIAVYSGDLPNTLNVSGACGDANEGSVIISLQPSIATNQRFVPNDSATITVTSGGGNLAGNVRFRLFTTADCTGSALIDQTVAVSGASPQTVSTTNTTAITTTQTNLSWLVQYTSTNAAHRGVQSVCRTENASLTIDNGSTSTTTFP